MFCRSIQPCRECARFLSPCKSALAKKNGCTSLAYLLTVNIGTERIVDQSIRLQFCADEVSFLHIYIYVRYTEVLCAFCISIYMYTILCTLYKLCTLLLRLRILFASQPVWCFNWCVCCQLCKPVSPYNQHRWNTMYCWELHHCIDLYL